MPASGSAWNRLRAQLKAQWQREGRACALCHQPIDYNAPAGKPRAFTLDHILATSHGGEPLRISNLRAVCASCNSARGNGEGRRSRFDYPTSRTW
ncbi:HNH endonuclease [Frigoribacterium sp. PhB160]|nr:HNH endonuclease [Frigoribacterium sp. PhB160]